MPQQIQKNIRQSYKKAKLTLETQEKTQPNQIREELKNHVWISKSRCHSRQCRSSRSTNSSPRQRDARKSLEQTACTTSRPRMGLLARPSRPRPKHHCRIHNHNLSLNLFSHRFQHSNPINSKLRRQTSAPSLNLRRPHLLVRLQQLRRLLPASTRLHSPLPQKRKAALGRPTQLTRRLLDLPRPQRSRPCILGKDCFARCG